MKATWEAHDEPGSLSSRDRKELPDSVYAFPDHRKEPMTSASHVRSAIARFDQVQGVSDDDRAKAFANVQKAAKHYGVEMTETRWQDLRERPRSTDSEHKG